MATTSELEAALAKFRAELDAGERRAADRLVRAYGTAWKATQAELEGLLAKVAEARAAGEAVSPAWLYQQRRMEVVLGTLEEGLRTYAPDAGAEVLDTQRRAVQAAQAHTRELLQLELPHGIAGTFEVMPEAALRDLIGFAGDGSPLRALFDAMPAQARQALEAELVAGLAQGVSPRLIAARARRRMGAELARALTIARTEVNRSYRESTRRGLEEHRDVVAGWTWVCATDARSCAVCWAMHGRQFPVEETLDGHPNCRCAMVPVTRTWAALGFDDLNDTRPELEPGEALFDHLPEHVQRGILGPGKFEEYAEGRLRLTDVVGRRTSPRWGTMRTERPLYELRELRELGLLEADHATRLGPGLVDADKPHRRRATPRSHEERLEELRHYAGQYGVSVEQLTEARRALPDVKAALKAEARRTGHEWWPRTQTEVDLPRKPPKRMLRQLGGRKGWESTADASWDWWETITPEEGKRLRKWMGRQEGSLDTFVDAWRLEHGRVGMGDREVVEQWREAVRHVDGARALEAGRNPSYIDASELAPELAEELGMDVGLLLGNELDAAGELARAIAERTAHEAQRILGPDRGTALGPAPWRMTTWSYREELLEVESRLRDARYSGGRPPADLVDRWHELVPGGDDRDLQGELLSPEALHDLVLDLAQRAGYQ